MKDIFSLKAPRINPNDDEMLFHGYSLNIGDKIKEGDIIATAETSKATFDIESPVSGKILELIFKEGDIISVGDTIATIELNQDSFSTNKESSTINSTKKDGLYNFYKLSLLYKKKSDYKTAKDLIKPFYEKNRENIYLAVLYAELLNNTNNSNEAINILKNLKDIYPFNSSISFYLAETLIKNNLNLDYASEILKTIENSHKYNPNYLRLMSRMFVLKEDIFNSKIYLSEYHLLLDNLNLAVQVLNDGIQSKRLNSNEIAILQKKKKQIICKYQRPLEPIFGEKTCN